MTKTKLMSHFFLDLAKALNSISTDAFNKVLKEFY